MDKSKMPNIPKDITPHNLSSPLDAQVSALSTAALDVSGGSMKSIFEKAIKNGGYSLPTMLSRIDSYHISGKLSDDDREDLYAQARDGAQQKDEVDLYAKVLELEKQVRDLKKLVKVLTGKVEQDAPSDGDATDYVPGKWYRSGDRVMFEGKAHTCIAPEGIVCTWSPAEYPAYWQADSE